MLLWARWEVRVWIGEDLHVGCQLVSLEGRLPAAVRRLAPQSRKSTARSAWLVALTRARACAAYITNCARHAAL